MVEAAFVLAAGKGERLRPLTKSRPKPLVTLGDREILAYVFDFLETLSLKRVVVNAWYEADQIERFVERERATRPFKIEVSREDKLLGTGGGLKKALPKIGEPPFLMLNGDSLIRGDLSAFVESAQRAPDEAVWWLAPARPPESVIGLDSKEQIQQIGSLWQSGATIESTGLFTGLQVFKEVHSDTLPDVGCIIRDYWISRLRAGSTLAGRRQALKEFLDLGTLDRLEEAKRSFL